jgi:hypothetical protein
MIIGPCPYRVGHGGPPTNSEPARPSIVKLESSGHPADSPGPAWAPADELITSDQILLVCLNILMAVCVLDKGGTGTRIGVFGDKADKGKIQIRAARAAEDADPDWGLWTEQEGLGNRILSLFEREFSLNPLNIQFVVMSLSGTVDHSKRAVLLKSDRISECMQGLLRVPYEFKLPFDVNVFAVNDGVAAAVGIADVIDCKCLPALVITLGTFPAITVVNGNSKVALTVYTTVFSKEAKIDTSDGQGMSVNECLSGRALQPLNPDRKVGRIVRAVAAILSLYLVRFKWLPRSIVMMGGHSVDLHGQGPRIESELKTSINRTQGATHEFLLSHATDSNFLNLIFCPDGDDYAAQSKVHMNGARVYAELHMLNKIRVF